MIWDDMIIGMILKIAPNNIYWNRMVKYEKIKMEKKIKKLNKTEWKIRLHEILKLCVKIKWF